MSDLAVPQQYACSASQRTGEEARSDPRRPRHRLDWVPLHAYKLRPKSSGINIVMQLE